MIGFWLRNGEKRGICYKCVCLSVCLSVYLSIYLSIYHNLESRLNGSLYRNMLLLRTTERRTQFLKRSSKFRNPEPLR